MRIPLLIAICIAMLAAPLMAADRPNTEWRAQYR